jgi:S-adenosylmethionine/arginine decarboxylase-like enzyme
MIERNGPWGQHLMIDVVCDKSKITDEANIKNFARELVKRIDMKAYGEPVAVDFANDDPGKGGYTLVQLIETSNICAHFVSATGEAYFDVFSCKTFDVSVVANTVEEFFGPISHGVGSNIYRGAWNEADSAD